jgi:glycosyltransferase involved in cell wall biosynthesis
MPKNPTKVVHLTSVHSALDPRIFHKECKSLARAGFEVTVVGPYVNDMVSEEVRIKAIPQVQSRIGRMTRTVWRVYREALKQQADIYHFHDPELILVGLLLRAGGKAVIYDIHEDVPKDVMSKEYLPPWSRRLISVLAAKLETSCSGYFSALVIVTPSIANRFTKINKHIAIVCNYPYDKEIVVPEGTSSWSVRRDSVVYIGNISCQRGIGEMITAIGLLPENLPATLELVGNRVIDGVAPGELEAQPGWKRVRHYGIMDQPSTFRILHEVRAGLVLFQPVPNHIEAMPQKMFEYMGAGIPVIASDFPLWRHILGDTGCGIFVDPTNPNAIAKAIEYVLTHPEEAEEMGKRGRAAVIERYNWDTQAQELVKLYAGLRQTCVA